VLAKLLLPDVEHIELKTVTTEERIIRLHLQSTATTSLCPTCHHTSQRVHSQYQRSPADLPWAGVAVKLHVQLRRFKCETAACPRRTFVERVPTLVAPSARQTTRLAAVLLELGLTAGGEGGARLGQTLGLKTSPDSLLRLIRRAPLPPTKTPRAVGIDEWAWRKGRRYGTILVDLEKHEVVDLLPDDQRETIVAWFKAHPEIEVVSRDRSGAFASAASEGVPAAQQVADRFHLLQNITDVLKRTLERSGPQLETIRQRPAPAAAASSAAVLESEVVAPTVLGEEPTAPAAAPAAPLGRGRSSKAPTSQAARPLGRAEQQRLERLAEREARYEEVWRLFRAGMTKWEIARTVGHSRKTIIRWLNSSAYPAHPGAKGRGQALKSRLDPYKPYLLRRYQEGCHTASVLFHEIKQQGYQGSDSLVRRFVTRIRRSSDDPTVLTKKAERYSFRDLAFAVVRRPDERSPEQASLVTGLQGLEGPVQIATQLTLSFATLIRDRQAEGLTAWLDQAEGSGLAPFRTFVEGLRRDERAVRAALSLEWNNGQTEGQINRLKLLKRTMYGRATFDLLKRRVLLAA
jgi:transposase